jgi:ssDNA-binding Zn-finger/Zn-ribbon topoisomerase 1
VSNAYLRLKLSEKVGQKTRQACPECGAVMVIRQNKHDQSFFLGCHNYPDCKHTMDIPESMKLGLLGYQQLPGFGDISQVEVNHDQAQS